MVRGRSYRSRASRQASRVLLLVMAVGWTVAGLLTGWAALDEARGGVVDAEVVGIKWNDAGRRMYDVRFDVAGHACESHVDSGSKPLPRDIHVGGHSRLRYSASDPCKKVRETIAGGPWPFPIIHAAIAVGCLIGVWRLRPDPTQPATAGTLGERRQAS
nr:hypothetical protein GCM10020063_043610 [Dactylosporangium thailandense]